MRMKALCGQKRSGRKPAQRGVCDRLSFVYIDSFSCAADKRQKKAKAEARALVAHNTNNGDESASNAPTRHPSAEDMDVDMDGGAGGDANGTGDGAGKEGAGGSKDSQPPGKKFRLTETMKAIVWELVLLSNECCRLENEKK